MKTRNVIKYLSCAIAGSALSFSLTGCQRNNVQTKDSFATIEKEFKDPSADFRSAPLAVWNSKVTEAEVERTMRELKDAGFGGLFIHPRPGMITEYLGDEWFSLYKHAVEFGKELGINVWIYDENSYPSGFAGGHVPAEMPESCNQGQGLALTKVDLLPEDTKPYYMCLR